ncbi:MAG: sulfur carrier protein ThiS [Verrucomicrobiales bacterium]|jgi:sulfur carrier protein|nr:sulfur carrier protein ThiS [Verrucomicrobiales bacterium]
MNEIAISVNGELRRVASTTKIDDLLQVAGLDPKAILVELNQVALQRREIPGVILKDGDRIEFIRIVAGG